MDVVSIHVSSRSLQEPPVPAFIVGDVSLDLVVLPHVSNQHAFNSCHLIGHRHINMLDLNFTLLQTSREHLIFIPRS